MEHEIKFGTLHEDGTLTNVRLIKQSDIGRCHHHILVVSHYRDDGSCKCDDPEEQVMMIQEWGYKKSDFKKRRNNMGRYTVVTRDVHVVGKGWYGHGITYTYSIPKDVVDEMGELTREKIQDWLDRNSGDFQQVDDFYASIDEWESPWQDEESEGYFFRMTEGENDGSE